MDINNIDNNTFRIDNTSYIKRDYYVVYSSKFGTIDAINLKNKFTDDDFIFDDFKTFKELTYEGGSEFNSIFELSEYITKIISYSNPISITLSINSNDGYIEEVDDNVFRISGISYVKGDYLIEYSNKFGSIDSINLKNKYTNDELFTDPKPYTDFNSPSGSFSNLQELSTFLAPIISYRIVSSSSGSGDNYYVNNINFNSGSGNLNIEREGLNTLSASLDGRYIQSGSNISQLNNDEGYITEIPSGVISGSVSRPGDNISDFNNDVNYVISGSSNSQFINDKNYIQSGSYISQLYNDAGYLTSYTETDPIFQSSVAATITESDFINWNDAYAWGDHSLMGYQLESEKGAANGYVPLNGSAQIDSQYLPSFVDDVIEAADYASLPTTGETGKLYITLDTNFTYRWGGSAYVQIGGSGAGTVDSVFGRVGAITAQVGDYSAFYSLLDHTHTISDITDFTDNSTNWNAAFTWGDWSTGVDKTFIDALNVDADTLDSLDSSQFLRSDTSDTIDGNLTVLGNSTSANTVIRDLNFTNEGYTSSDKRSIIIRHRTGTIAGEDTSDLQIITRDNGDFIYGLRQNQDGLTYDGGKVWHEGNDGSGSGLDADLLDGLNSSQFLRSDQTTTGTRLWLNGAIDGQDGSGALLQVNGFIRTGNIYLHSGGVTPNSDRTGDALSNVGGVMQWRGNTVWHSGNDGTGSGLDADLLDGLDSSQFLRSDTDATIYGTFTINAGVNEPLRIHGSGLKSDSTAKNLVIGKDSAGDNLWYIGFASNAGNDLYLYNYVGANYIRLLDDGGKDGLYYNYSGGAGKLWHSGNDGTGSGLDADLLDGWNTTQSGARFNSIPTISNTGVMEIGQYIDFHTSHDDTSDYKSRLQGDSSTLKFYTEGTNSSRIQAYYSSTNYVNLSAGSGGSIIQLYDSANTTTILRSYGDSDFYGGGINIYKSAANLHLESGAITRGAHNSGYLEGSYNNVGGNANQSNPIYVIGSGYVPSTTTLDNMFGIGYCHSGASFIGSEDLGASPSGWGLYVAADGNARVFLDSTYGRGYFKTYVYATDFITHSDRRKKENIRDAEIIDKPIQWRTFDKKEEWGGDKDKCGVIAQELKETHPQFVDDNDPDALSVRYTDLFAHELAKKDKQVKELEDRVERLETLVEILIREK